MPNLKLQVSRALTVIPSALTNIPMPNVITTGVATSTLLGQLEDTTKDFIALGVQVGDTIYNGTAASAFMVTNVDSATILSLNGGLITIGDSYRLYSGTNISGSLEPSVLYVGTAGDLSVVTAGGDSVNFVGVTAGSFIPVHIIQVLPTSTAANIIALW